MMLRARCIHAPALQPPRPAALLLLHARLATGMGGQHMHGDPGTTWLLANGTKSVNSSPSFSLGQTWRSFSRAHKFGQIFARLAKQRLLSHVNLGLYVLFTSIISALHRKRRPHIDSPRSPIDHSLFHVRSLFVESIPTKPINTAPPYYSPSHHYHELRREEEVRHIE